MDSQRIESIKRQLSLYPTEELVEIWQSHDSGKWTREAFEAVRQILLERLETLPAYEDRERADRHLDRAQNDLDAEDLDRALAECRLAIEAAPHYAQAHHALGVVFEELSRWDEAANAYQEALRLEPKLSDAKRGLQYAAREQARQVEEARLTQYGQMLEGEDMEPAQLFLDEVVATDETAKLRGWPGYRTRPGRSGLDYIDTAAEESHLEGVLLRLLITGSLRTKNPFHWFLMALAAAFCLFPSIFVFGSMGSYSSLTCLFSIIYIPMGIIGILFLYNLGRSISMQPGAIPEEDEGDEPEN